MTPSRASSGFSYIEVLIAVVILAGAVLSLGYALEASRDVEARGAWQLRADYLVEDGLIRVRMLKRRDPQTPDSFGMEPNDVASVDDVDDLDMVIESNPVDRLYRAAGSDWKREYVVQCVDLATPKVVVADGASNLMRVGVRVLRNQVELASEVVYLWRK